VGRLVRKDDVCVLAQVTQAAGGLRSALVADAVLQVVEGPRDGRCECRLYYRYVDPLAAGPGVLGYRCLKVATTESPLRLRVVRGDKSREALNALNVALSTAPDAAPAENHSTNLNEPVTSRQAYRNLAFVRISKGGVHLAGPFPVPVLGDVPVTCPVGVAPEAERRGAVAARLRNWDRRLDDAAVIYAKVVTDFNKTSGKAPEVALQKSRHGLGLLRTELLNLEGEFRALRAEAAKVKPDL